MACRLRLSWDRVIDPHAKYVFLDKRVRGAQANVDVRKLMREALGQDADQDNADQASVNRRHIPQNLHRISVSAV